MIAANLFLLSIWNNPFSFSMNLFSKIESRLSKSTFRVSLSMSTKKGDAPKGVTAFQKQ